MTKKNIILTLAVAAIMSIGAVANAGVIPIAASDVYAHNEKNNYGGNPTSMVIGSGMNDNPNTGGPMPADITQWTATSSNYTNEWQGMDVLAAQTPAEDLDAAGNLVADGAIPGTNGKIGWCAFDLGSEQTVGDLYIWHIRENSGRVAETFNVYVAVSPTVALAHGPTNDTSRDYDFASGGWTLIEAVTGGTHQGDQVVDLLDSQAQYIGIEILTNGGDVKVGFAEIGVTEGVPEPATMSLLALGGLAMLRRKRRA